MENSEIKIVYEDDNLLVVDKPAGIIVFPEGNVKGKTLVDYLLRKYSYLRNVGERPRYGIIHRLDKDTSGILLVAKNNKSLIFFQKQFKNRNIKKKYTCLVVGNIRVENRLIKTLIGRSPKDRKKQKVYLLNDPLANGKREAITEYKLVRNFENCSLLNVLIKTGRKHQIRCHLSYIGHPIVGDKIYGFKNQFMPKELKRQFLHASYLKIKLPNGKMKEFYSELPKELKNILDDIKKNNK